MFRNIAIATAVLACAAGAGSLSAQTSAPAAKPAPTAQKPAKTTPATAAVHSDTTKAAMTHHAAWTKTEIQEAQTGLAKAGYYKGKPTGQLNADTRKALRAYQKANNMPATGRLSDSVLVKLKSA